MLPATLLAAEKAQPLIDIDATVFIQFGIFLVMAAVLWATVFKPYLGIQAERERRIDGARRDARTMADRAQAMTADYEAQLLRAKKRGADERLRLRDEGRAHEQQVLSKAREIGQKALEEAQRKAETQRQAAREKLTAESQVIGRRIAARILGREV